MAKILVYIYARNYWGIAGIESRLIEMVLGVISGALFDILANHK